MAAKESTIIRIDEDLYARLRKHCDSESIRFLDFVENSLEDALSRETVTEVLADELESLRSKVVKYEYAFNLGFKRGFAFLYLMLKGLSMPRAAEEDLDLLKKFPAGVPKGEQIGLF